MPATAIRSTLCLALAACVALALPMTAAAKPVTKIGELVDWDPARKGDLPKSLAKVDPNVVVMAKDTLDVLPKMLTKMETVILNLTELRTQVRLDELMASILPDAEKGRGEAPADIHAFVIGRVIEKLGPDGAPVPMAEFEKLVAAVEGGPAKEFVGGLAELGAQIPLSVLLTRVETSADTVRDYFRPTVMTHLEHGHAGMCCSESDDPWSISLTALGKAADAQKSKAVRDYVAGLPIWVVHHRMEKEAPDVPIHQLTAMLAAARTAYGKTIARPLVTEKDLQAPGKVAYMLQEAYARSEQINNDLVARDVIGVIVVATLLVLLSALRGYIKALDIPNRRITE